MAGPPLPAPERKLETPQPNAPAVEPARPTEHVEAANSLLAAMIAGGMESALNLVLPGDDSLGIPGFGMAGKAKVNAPQGAPDVRIIPADQVREPGPDDLLLGMFDRKLVVLPAAGSMVLLLPPPSSHHVPPTQLLAVPTIAKESSKMVNVGGRAGFMIDVGGRPGVIFPAALGIMTERLGVDRISGVIVTHLHEDHVRSLVEVIRTYRIPPKNLHFPEAFKVNPQAPSSVFARLLQQLEADAQLRAIGHGPEAAYRTIATPAAGQGDYFRIPLRVGEVDFEFYGISAAFRALQARRAAGQAQEGAEVEGQWVPSIADTASIVTRITHRTSGFRILAISDMRFSDLPLLRAAMGVSAYDEMLSGVRIIEGLGHHLGAFRPEDRAELVELLVRTQLRSGRLVVMAQSQEVYGRSGQFVNRSLMEALRSAGIDVHVALEPGPSGVGTYTATTTGEVRFAGPGRSTTLTGDAAVQSEIARLNRLREAEESLSRYERFWDPRDRRSAEARAARVILERALVDHLRLTVGGIRSGASGRAQANLTDPAAQAESLRRIQLLHAPIEDDLLPGAMESLRKLRRDGPHLEKLEQEIRNARITGRMSKEGIDALWELDPETARSLVRRSSMPRRTQRQTMAQLPGAGPRAFTYRVAGGLLAIEAINLAAPLVGEYQRQTFAVDVAESLGDLNWWLDKGVVPQVRAFESNWLVSDVDTTNLEEVSTMVIKDKIDYLAVTGIAEEALLRFTVWSATHLLNYRDWDSFVGAAERAGTLRSSGNAMETLTWEYRTSTLSKGTVWGVNRTSSWATSPLLTRALQSAAAAVVSGTSAQIAAARTRPGQRSGTFRILESDLYRSPHLFERLPQATGRRRFRPSVSERTLYTVRGRHPRTDFPAESIFLVFPSEATSEDVPEGYVAVGGADFNTYALIYAVSNVVSMEVEGPYGSHTVSRNLQPNTLELLLARAADLEDAP